MRRQVYSKKNLILLLKEWVRKHGETPSKRQWNEDASTPSDRPYRINFGSWGNALKVCSLKQKDRPHKGRKKGGRNKTRKRIKTVYGYIQIFEPNHIQAGKNGYVFEHRKVMADFVGRRLKWNEQVHHKNHNKRDNRLSNLKLMSCEEHTRMHKNAKKH